MQKVSLNCSHFFFFPPSPNSGQCHCMFAVERRLVHKLCNVKKPGRSRPEETRRRERNVMRDKPCSHAHIITRPLLCSSGGSSQPNKYVWTGRGGTQCKFPPQNHAGSLVNKNNREHEREREKKKVPCSAFRCASSSRGKSDRSRKRSENNTPILHVYCHYACFA